jgi:hypothetical protein
MITLLFHCRRELEIKNNSFESQKPNGNFFKECIAIKGPLTEYK